VRAAEGVELALQQTGANVTIANVDVLTLMPPAFRKVYRDGYFEMVARSPRILDWLYDATDKPFSQDRMRRRIERAGTTRLLKRIHEFDPDVAICTHFLPTALLLQSVGFAHPILLIFSRVLGFIQICGFKLGTSQLRKPTTRRIQPEAHPRVARFPSS